MTKVLFLEPDAVLGELYMDALQQSGIEVMCCNDAQEGIILMDSFAPDIVVMELQLVGHDGIEFLQELRSYPEWLMVPVIILTNTAPSALQPLRQALQRDLGVQDVLYKPRTELRSLAMAISRYCA